MGGSPSAPRETDAQRKSREEQEELLELQKKQAEQPLDFNLPTFKPLPPPPPPAVQTSSDVVQAEENARRAAARRTNTYRGTIFAGDTGGYQPPVGSRTLLGGA